jgi:hypothetical protein
MCASVLTPSPQPLMSGQLPTAQLPTGSVETIFRSSGGGAARKRPHSGIYVRRWPAPRQYRVTAFRRMEISERWNRTSIRLIRSSHAQLRARMHPSPVPC